MKKLNNTVIKNLSPEMGKEIIKKYQADGWDTIGALGVQYESGGDLLIYYGVIDWEFFHYSLVQVQSANARIIELDYEHEFIPKRGDMVMVWNSDESDAEKQIYLTTIEGCICPIVSVYPDDADKFIKGEVFSITVTRNMKPIPTEQPKPERDIKAEIRAAFNEMSRLIEEL